MLNRRSVLSAAAIAPVLSAGPVARAQTAPRPRAPLPGALRLAIGDFIVTALLDGSIDLPLSVFPGLTEAEAAPLLEQMLASQPIRAAVNAFLVEGRGRTTLIDTGAAGRMGPTLGRLPRALAAAGITASSVDIVALTHAHPDHANGLLRPDGAAAFPNAELVLHQAERSFWLDEGMRSRAPAEMQHFFDGVRSTLGPYSTRTRLLARAGEEVAPGISASPLPGHTPGHTGFRIADGREELLIWGDIVHAPALQFARPDLSLSFDTDMQTAATTRRRLLDEVSSSRTLVAGSHLDFPGIGHVQKDRGTYRFVPLPWQTAL